MKFCLRSSECFCWEKTVSSQVESYLCCTRSNLVCEKNWEFLDIIKMSSNLSILFDGAGGERVRVVSCCRGAVARY